ncbi:MAG: DUF364 domain-containing protein [Hydrogenoanaerobacterium sp.]
MTEEMLFSKLKSEFTQIVNEHHIESEKVHITGRALSPQEAIGVTERKDFPILTGKEQMLEAEFMGSKGQAFTDAPSLFFGSLLDVIKLDLMSDMHSRGLFIATMNAVMRNLGLAEHTIHCKNQPALLEQLSSEYTLRVLDLNTDNIGQMRYGIKVENGLEYKPVCDWADLVLCTGSTLCNGTIVNFLDMKKEIVFFGTTAAGAAKILGLKRMCFCAE